MTMTLHKISAGDGYDYLTRQVARGDQQKIKGQSLSDYYTRSGEPPGRWFGRGEERLGVSGEVTEAQMQNLYGEGLDPAAGRKLGRAFPVYKGQGSTPYSRAYFTALTTFREQHGRGAEEKERMALRLSVARDTLVALGREAEARRPAAVRAFDAEQR